MRSRWTDFLDSDGGKADRHRDHEFNDPPTSRDALLKIWEDGALESLSEADLSRTITIRGEPHPMTQPINRQVAHYAFHSGQIVMLAENLASDHRQTLSVARNKSTEFNHRVTVGEASQR